MAENVRPDLNLVAAVLSTRVIKPTFDDKAKLQRALAYLNKTKEFTLKIDNSPFDCVHAYIDASHGSHTDTISHSGMVLILGNTHVMFKSKKQHIITRSCTVVELVAFMDITQYAVYLSDFLAALGTSCADAGQSICS